MGPFYFLRSEGKTVLNHLYSRNILIYAISFAGLWLLLWLLTGSVTLDGRSQNNGSSHEVLRSQTSHAAMQEFDQRKIVGSVAPSNDLTISSNRFVFDQCSFLCQKSISALEGGELLSDSMLYKLGAHSEELAVYLQHNKDRRHDILELALTTESADTRAFLTDIFMHLPHHQKAELGENYIASQDWQIRADGVKLIADDISVQGVAKKLMIIFAGEENSYVKRRILAGIKQNLGLRGDPEILHGLDSALYYDPAVSVRTAALKAKMQLSEYPHLILPDALQALRTSEPDFQLAGIMAIEYVLQSEKEHGENGTYIDYRSIERELEILSHLADYPRDERFKRLVKEANLVRRKYFAH